jgi:hypothetical protein
VRGRLLTRLQNAGDPSERQETAEEFVRLHRKFGTSYYYEGAKQTLEMKKKRAGEAGADADGIDDAGPDQMDDEAEELTAEFCCNALRVCERMRESAHLERAQHLVVQALWATTPMLEFDEVLSAVNPPYTIAVDDGVQKPQLIDLRRGFSIQPLEWTDMHTGSLKISIPDVRGMQALADSFPMRALEALQCRVDNRRCEPPDWAMRKIREWVGLPVDDKDNTSAKPSSFPPQLRHATVKMLRGLSNGMPDRGSVCDLVLFLAKSISGDPFLTEILQLVGPAAPDGGNPPDAGKSMTGALVARFFGQMSTYMTRTHHTIIGKDGMHTSGISANPELLNCAFRRLLVVDEVPDNFELDEVKLTKIVPHGPSNPQQVRGLNSDANLLPISACGLLNGNAVARGIHKPQIGGKRYGAVSVSIAMDKEQYDLNMATKPGEPLPPGLTLTSRRDWEHYGESNIIPKDPDFDARSGNDVFDNMGKALGLISLLALIHVRTQLDGVWPARSVASQALLKSRTNSQRVLHSVSRGVDIEITLAKWFLADYTYKENHGCEGNKVMQRLRSSDGDFFKEVNEQLMTKKQAELELQHNRVTPAYVFTHVLADAVDAFIESEESGSNAARPIRRHDDPRKSKRFPTGVMKYPIIGYSIKVGS